jgi:hypothetical protein
MMGVTMKSAAFLLCVIALAMTFPAVAADSSGVQTVYLLPMANGLDQYLASRLVASSAFHVTTDPKKADAFFTDKLGEAFEQRLDALFPPAEEKTSKDGKNKESGGLPPSSFSRAKGTIFLVDAATRSILWSAYEPSKNTTPSELNRTAERIVARLTEPGKRK